MCQPESTSQQGHGGGAQTEEAAQLARSQVGKQPALRRPPLVHQLAGHSSELQALSHYHARLNCTIPISPASFRLLFSKKSGFGSASFLAPSSVG